jgi:uncharacterized protein
MVIGCGEAPWRCFPVHARLKRKGPSSGVLSLRFLAFITVFLSLYGLLHGYAFLKVQRAFQPTRGTAAVLVCFLLVMIFSPLIARLTEKLAMDAPSRALAMAAFVWMGFLFMFVSAALLLDLLRLICIMGAHLFRTELPTWIASARVVFFAALTAALLGSMVGYLEAMTVRTVHVTIRTPKIPKAIKRLRIVQVSDIHLGWIVGEERLRKILSKVQEAAPDVLVSTGDLVDGQMNNASGLAEMFQGIHAPFGKFAVMGNHEFYAGLDRSLRFTEASGFEILRGAAKDVGGVITIAGVDDEAGRRDGLLAGEDEAALLSHIPADRFVLLLKHRPDTRPTGDRVFDLQLSGHTHGGQIFPFGLIVKMIYPEAQGLARLGPGAYLYVSRGAGTWGPPIRFLAPPEITVIDLVYDTAPGRSSTPRTVSSVSQ